MKLTAPSPPHVLVFPFPLQGPVNCTFKIAELLCLAGIHVTFMVTEHIHTRLLQNTNIQARFDHYPGFQLRSISDGLPADHPRSGERMSEVFLSLSTITKEILREMLTSGCLSGKDGRNPVKFIIADGVMGFTCDVANEVGVPIVYVRTISPCSLWIFFCIPKLLETGQLPLTPGCDLDILIDGVPETESFLRRRDLPSFFRLGDSNEGLVKVCKTEFREIPRAHGFILNTFEELDESIISHMRTVCPNIYTIGPVHELLKSQLSTQVAAPTTDSSTSLWQEDKNCLEWLDLKPLKSVIYVSFGSIAWLPKEQLYEFWHGLVNSGIDFLWVIRPDSTAGKDWESTVPVELREGTEKRGHIVEWAPQEEVLAHHAVGGFLTHSGWNSTLESISAGVPMITWPCFYDQQVNSRFASEVWKVGLDMKDTCDRSTIEKMVRELMHVRKQEFLDRAAELADSAKNCLMKGGSSYRNLDRLIKDIHSMTS